MTSMEYDILECLKKCKTVHFIGIGGISMSALALILKTRGYTVKGSDNNIAGCESLINAGIKVYNGQSADNIEDAQLVVYTAAIKADNPELKKARDMGIPCFERAYLLGAIMKGYKCPIGISGTHGKSTTTSMISCILLKAQTDPTISVGAILPEIDSNYHIGSDNYFVFESCEYAASFLHFFPMISLILNIDEDHLDFYRDIDHIVDTFKEYTNNTLEDGIIITNAEDKNCLKATKDYSGKIITFGIENGDYTAENIKYTAGLPSFDIIENDNRILNVKLNVPGKHNILNALAAAACCRHLGIPNEYIKSGLESFHGAKRRFETKGNTEKYTVIDDYAHHPSEIKATLNAAKNMDFDKIVLVFQPHTYSRTKALLPRFIEALSIADKVILCDIYAAREKDNLGVSSQMLADEIPNAVYAESFEKAALIAKEETTGNSLILTMGAGDVYKTADYLV